MKRRLITAALPYVNNIPHLGNLIQVISADVFARFSKQAGYESIYICGSDEYGTATETRALQEKISPRELCDKFFVIHRDIYAWFNIDFDLFGRTSSPQQSEIVQKIFTDIKNNGYIKKKETKQTFCSNCNRFLADRYVHGTCPHCKSTEARGDQCDSCGRLLDPLELIKPKCGTCQNPPIIKNTTHLFLDMPKLEPELRAWIAESSTRGNWAKNALKMANSWLRDGIRERGISRDLDWGVSIPEKGMENKVFYVWFDAPIGYISITMNLSEDWEHWWKKPDEVELFNFIGKDNIPFHAIFFPAALIATKDNWVKLHHLSSSEYLNYEDGKFSKSRNKGVFGDDCRETGIPADVWRFYLIYNRPEKTDYRFTWRDFQVLINSELIGNLSNFINRTLSFSTRFLDSTIITKPSSMEQDFIHTVRQIEDSIYKSLDTVQLRDSLRLVLRLSSYGNRVFQEAEPWRLIKEDKAQTQILIDSLLYIVRDLAIIIRPFLPKTSADLAEFLSIDNFSWQQVASFTGLQHIKKSALLFKRLEDKQIRELQERFAGPRQSSNEGHEIFNRLVELRIGKIIAVEKHPYADKLYVEKVDCGEHEPRTIVSGIAPFYSLDELLNKKIVLVSNLKPAKIRGVKSNGMLLAASSEALDEKLELIEPKGLVGERIGIGDLSTKQEEHLARISANKFFSVQLKLVEARVQVAGQELKDSSGALKTRLIKNGIVS